MHSLYNRVAGQNVERIAAFSDGIFAAAMLVLDHFHAASGLKGCFPPRP
jgi:hypothetical protein